MSRGIEERFWEKVDIGNTGECWEWQGCKLPAGYGKLGRKYETVYAHRISWTLNHGNIPNGICVLHKCDNPSCVNPEHLFLGTLDDNNKDMTRKRRQARGETQSWAKLTESDVRIARRLYTEEGISFKALGQRFGVRDTTIREAILGITWGHVE